MLALYGHKFYSGFEQTGFVYVQTIGSRTDVMNFVPELHDKIYDTPMCVYLSSSNTFILWSMLVFCDQSL